LKVTGDKIVLRDWSALDGAALRSAFSPGKKWMRLDAPYFDKSDVEGLIRRFEKPQNPELSSTLVIANPVDDTLMGLVCWNWESQESRWPSVGIVLYDETQWRRGFGFEALGLWCQLVFDSLGVHRIDLRTWSGNEAIQALARKLGFCEEARFREARQVEGKYFDSLAFGILREEWTSRHPHEFKPQTETVLIPVQNQSKDPAA
jgi:RimJ/RimL family protein N-acetyltransferase